MSKNDLQAYLSRGIANIVKGILKSAAGNPEESIFLLQFAKESVKAAWLRREAEARGEHIPPFLIASITQNCNLHCKGCYARENQSCYDGEPAGMLSAERWESIFEEAAKLGVSFILLAGGEPFLRREVMEAAGRQKKILFPVFTNGTLIDSGSVEFIKDCRNLLPILSLEGSEETTDKRRGEGTAGNLKLAMEILHKNGILFGASVTVQKENMREVLSPEFTEGLAAAGCRGIIYVEYVPVDRHSADIAPDQTDREYMESRLHVLQKTQKEMLFLSFPGDEKGAGGCLAAGRGFFHINPRGGAEPCPFSPYSDTSLADTSLKEALASPLFLKLRRNGNLAQEHSGGCALFAQEAQVRELCGEEGL